MKRKVVWNGIEYNSLDDACKDLSISKPRLRKRLMRGFTSDIDIIQSVSSKRRSVKSEQSIKSRFAIRKQSDPCSWNGVDYESVAHAAGALRLNIDEVIDRILSGFTSDSDMNTEWLPIPNYEGLYIISKTGLINRVDPLVRNTPYRVSTHTVNDRNHGRVALFKGKSPNFHTVLSLMIVTFLDDGWLSGQHIQYLDNDQSNCSLDNLTWNHSAVKEIRRRTKQAIKQKHRTLMDDGVYMCRKCITIKPHNSDYFHRDNTRRTGLAPYCKECVASYQQEQWEGLKWSAKIAYTKRRARKQNLPDSFTVHDWEFALEYFNGCCAVCERPLKDLFGTHTAAADHWIPISYEGDDNPGTVPENIIPLCHGIAGCNNSKHSHMPDKWLKDIYGTRKANEILARINEYFEHINVLNAEDIA